jgi:hypothetical protein
MTWTDEVKTEAELLAEVPTKLDVARSRGEASQGNVDHQNLRNIITTMFSQVTGDAFGSMGSQDKASPIGIVLTNLNDWYPLIHLEAEAEVTDHVEFTADVVNGDYLEIMDEVAEGTYLITTDFQFSGTGGQDYEISIFVDNGVTDLESSCQVVRKLGVGGDVGSAGATAAVALSLGDKVRAKVRSTSGAGNSVDVASTHVVIHKVGN